MKNINVDARGTVFVSESSGTNPDGTAAIRSWTINGAAQYARHAPDFAADLALAGNKTARDKIDAAAAMLAQPAEANAK